MAKYAKLISLIILSILTLTGYTLYQQDIQADHTSVKLVTEEGEPDVLDNLHFLGLITSSSGNFSRSETFEYSQGNVNALTDLSFLEHLDYEFTPNMNRYIEDYRSFMRGKSRGPRNFAETRNHLVYTGMQSDVNWRAFNDNSLTIAMLNKNTGDEQEYAVTLADGSNQHVIATYVNYPAVTLITQVLDDNILKDWFIYAFDLENPQEELSPIVKMGAVFNSEHISFATNKDPSVRFIPFQVMQVESTDAYGQAELIPGEHFVFDTRSKEIQAVPETDANEGDFIVMSEEESLLIGLNLGETIEWSRWNVDDDTFTDIGSSEMMTPTIGRSQVHYYSSLYNQGLQLIDGYLYAFEEGYFEEIHTVASDPNFQNHEQISHPLFQVIDIESMDTVFSGYFTPEEQDDLSRPMLSLFDFGYSIFSN